MEKWSNNEYLSIEKMNKINEDLDERVTSNNSEIASIKENHEKRISLNETKIKNLENDYKGSCKLDIEAESKNGYSKFPNGCIIQWGETRCGSSGSEVWFPISFSNKLYKVATSQIKDGNTNGNFLFEIKSKNNMSMYSYGATRICSWIAIGC